MLKICAFIAVLMFLFTVPQPSNAQVGDLPDVRMITDNYDYMISLFPDDYPDRRKAIRACSTIAPAADSLKVFWGEQGEAALYYLSYYAGINWVEQDFDIQIVKYYPDWACHNPITIPLTGKKNGVAIEAVPSGLSLYLTLFQQLAKRLLEQASLPGGTPHYIASHPLLQKSPRRFDNLANLLALRTMADFTDIDSVLSVFKSAHWKKREPGQKVLFDYFWDKWQLSPDSTLAFLVSSEPYGSRLVALTRRPTRPRPPRSGWGNHQLQAPSGGQIGLSVARDRSGFFRVVDIDTLKLAYISGLRKDDLIRSVEGQAPRNIKQLFMFILDHVQQGAHVDIVRNDEPDAVIIFPWVEL